jgi:F0F1-type ATP synthase epsilon subunit
MHIAIHSIQSTLFEGDAEKLICETPMGRTTVLDHHLPIISQIDGPAVFVIGGDGTQTRVPLAGGFMEVRPGSDVVILAR